MCLFIHALHYLIINILSLLDFLLDVLNSKFELHYKLLIACFFQLEIIILLDQGLKIWLLEFLLIFSILLPHFMMTLARRSKHFAKDVFLLWFCIFCLNDLQLSACLIILIHHIDFQHRC